MLFKRVLKQFTVMVSLIAVSYAATPSPDKSGFIGVIQEKCDIQLIEKAPYLIVPRFTDFPRKNHFGRRLDGASIDTLVVMFSSISLERSPQETDLHNILIFIDGDPQNTSRVSVHDFITSDGSTVQIVPHDYRAWANVTKIEERQVVTTNSRGIHVMFNSGSSAPAEIQPAQVAAFKLLLQEVKEKHTLQYAIFNPKRISISERSIIMLQSIAETEGLQIVSPDYETLKSREYIEPRGLSYLTDLPPEEPAE
ncbi:MAG: N-acetylmuramoyl-L-alanine amidase [Holosporales bacterium]|jgi:hypothetical protein|nr:N-acetylmuramoyl-L-alanine amidase [Holosporales bacterium]